MTRHHEAPTRKLRGKENGKLGPDLLSFGHARLQRALSPSTSTRRSRSSGSARVAPRRRPAPVRDVVVEVDGERLVPSSIAPGWKWFEESHEAVLGRAIQSALEDGRASVKLVVERARSREPLPGSSPLRGARRALPAQRQARETLPRGPRGLGRARAAQERHLAGDERGQRGHGRARAPRDGRPRALGRHRALGRLPAEEQPRTLEDEGARVLAALLPGDPLLRARAEGGRRALPPLDRGGVQLAPDDDPRVEVGDPGLRARPRRAALRQQG